MSLGGTVPAPRSYTLFRYQSVLYKRPVSNPPWTVFVQPRASGSDALGGGFPPEPGAVDLEASPLCYSACQLPVVG